MFDNTNTPAEFTQELTDGINAVIQLLRSMKIGSMKIAGPKSGSWYRNLVYVYTQVHIRRLLTFLDAGRAEFLAGRYLITDMCARAIYETVAVYCDFAAQLGPLLDADEVDKIEDFLRTRMFATRLPDFIAEDKSVSATNILTQIDKMTKVSPTARKAYDHLSDIVHPNALGSLVYFTTLNAEDGTMTFPDETSSQERARDSFAASAVMLLHFHMALQELEPRLKKLSEGSPAP